MVNLNYMFPIPKSEISEFRMSDLNTYRDFVSRNEQGKYSHLLNKELSYINSIDIATKAQNLYNLKYSRPEHIVSQRCIDFKKMEALALQFKNK